eukprot:2349728-Amphidinium_carterae.1
MTKHPHKYTPVQLVGHQQDASSKHAQCLCEEIEAAHPKAQQNQQDVASGMLQVFSLWTQQDQ